MNLIAHVPPAEQLQQTPVPIYLEVAPFIQVGHVYIFFKGLGMADFERVEAARVGNGFGAEIQCMAAFPPQVSYYIAVTDPGNNPIAFAGSPGQPIVVPIVTTRSQPPPALPGRPSPPTCGEDCPPGLPGCQPGGGGAQFGARCGDASCQGDEEITCPADCVAGGGGDGDGDGDGDTDLGLPIVFIAVGAGVGGGFARDAVVQDPEDEDNSCPRNADPGSEEPGCVTVTGGGAISPGFVKAELGFFVADQISLGGNFRYQILSETRPTVANEFLPYHIEARVAYWLIRDKEAVFWPYLFAGTGYGMIQPQVTVPRGGGEAPLTIYQNSGFNNVSAGGGGVYYFSEPGGMGLNVQLDFDYFFPVTYANIDLGVALQFGF
jgi:hypothetical protein